MPKLIHSALSLLLLPGLTGPVASAHAAQTCRSESEIPSSTPTIAFTDHGDGTLTHQATGLMWMQCPLGQSGSDCATGSTTGYTWEGALEAAAASGFAGYTDWRVPDINELRSIVEERCYNPSINEAVFPATPASSFWSSSPVAFHSGNAWEVNFYDGSYHSGYSRDDSGRFVRLVHSGSLHE
jgi:hypothetical protein